MVLLFSYCGCLVVGLFAYVLLCCFEVGWLKLLLVPCVWFWFCLVYVDLVDCCFCIWLARC